MAVFHPIMRINYQYFLFGGEKGAFVAGRWWGWPAKYLRTNQAAHAIQVSGDIFGTWPPSCFPMNEKSVKAEGNRLRGHTAAPHTVSNS